MITIKDNINTLTPTQTQALKDKANAYPFDIYVTIGAGGSGKAAFQADVSSLVTRPGVVSIGVDPAHHFTFVRGSKDLGLPDGPEVASAGNVFFRQADLVGGIDSIAAKAKELRVSSRIVETAAGTPIVVHQHAMSKGFWWGLGGLGAVVLVVACWMWLSKRRRERELADEASALRAARAELNNEIGDVKIAKAMGGPGVSTRASTDDFDRRLAAVERKRAPVTPPPYYYDAPPPAPVIVQPTGSNDLLTGLLIGEALSDRHETVIRETRVVETPAPAPASSWSSSDSGSSSSWSDTSSSSSYDSGSNSDYGGSSGGDWGGGGGGDSW